jgi:hypothetical protein
MVVYPITGTQEMAMLIGAVGQQERSEEYLPLEATEGLSGSDLTIRKLCPIAGEIGVFLHLSSRPGF